MTARLFRLTIAALLTLGFAGFASPAFAHDQQTGSTPTNGELLATAPSEVSVTMSEDAIELGTTIVVIDHSGTDWVSDVAVSGATVTATLQSGLPEGVYTVEWRVVSADGHPVTGSFVFGIGSGQAITDELAIAAAVGAPPAETEEPSALESEETAPPAEVAAPTGPNIGVMQMLLAGLAGAGAIAALVLLVTRGGRGWSARGK